MRVLILTGSTGGGHQSAAYAIQQEAEKSGVDAVCIDTLAFVSQCFAKLYRGGYEYCVKHYPKACGIHYKASDRLRYVNTLQTAIELLCTVKLGMLVCNLRPDWIVCTHPLPLPVLHSIQQRSVESRIAVVITDIYPHRLWLRAEPDLYFVWDQWSRNALLRRCGVLPDEVVVSGIPINDAFWDGCIAGALESGWFCRDKTPLILITSGSIGGGDFIDVVKALSMLEVPCHAIFVCGHNAVAYRQCEAAIRGQQGRSLTTFEVKRNVPQEVMAALMRSSSFVIGKPGGLILSEVLASHRPFLIYEPFLIPGQEEWNARYIEKCGAALRTRSSEELRRVVGQLLKSPEKLAAMRANAEKIAHPHAARDIVRHIVEL